MKKNHSRAPPGREKPKPVMQPTTVASPKPGRNAEGGKYIERRDRLRENNIKPAEAAEILGVSPQFIRVAMQMGQLPIGIAIKLPGSSEYTYQISDNLLQQRTSKNVAEEIKRIRSTNQR